jgi:hypothetical protein
MKKNYLELGEVINFDSTNRMIKRVSPYMSKYSVGYWVAQDSNLRLAIVGMCFFIENESELIKQVFLYFFELVCGSVLPLVIFTEKSEMIAKVLYEIKCEKGYQFCHLYDWYHVTEELKEKL